MRKHVNWLATSLFSLCLPITALCQSKIVAVNHELVGDSLLVHVNGTDLTEPTKLSVYGGQVVLVEFKAQLMLKSKIVSINKNGIDNYRVVQFTMRPAPIARIAFKVMPGSAVSWIETAAGWDILVSQSANGVPFPTVSQAEDAKAMSEAIKLLASSPDAPPAIGLSQPQAVDSMALNGNQKASVAPSTIKPTEPTGRTAAQSRVRLEFSNVDITVILKALAEQTGSNIVTSPEVRGTLTVSLKNVTVEQALDLTTKLSGYRYAKIGNTYVVGTSSFLQKVLAQEPSSAPDLTVTRVVPLASRKAGEIKRAVIKALSIDSMNETIRIVHPQESGDLSDMPLTAEPGGAAAPPTSPPNGAEQPPAQSQQQATPSKPAAQQQPASAEGDADYLILIGERPRVEQAVFIITQIDAALADMAGLSSSGADLRPISATYQVRGGKAEDLAAAVKDFAGPVSVVATPKNSRAGQMIVLHGRPAEVERLMQILTQVDNVTAAGEPVYIVYDVKYSDPRALRDRLLAAFEHLSVATGPEGVTGMSYTSPDGQSGTSGTTGAAATQGTGLTAGVNVSGRPIYTDIEPKSVPMKLILSGPKWVIDQALSLLQAIDLPVPQIAIEARVLDMAKEEILKAGIHWDLFTGGAVKFIDLNNSQPPGSDGSPFNRMGVKIGGSDIGGDVIGTLDKALSKASFISRPNVIATDGRESVVFIGDVVRYVKSIQVTPTGTSVEVGEEEVGVKLNVLPRVGADKSINLEVQPTVSFIRSFLDTGTGGKIPITSVRTARSTMRIKNGETIAIGGLITEDDVREVSGIPLLMDLPIVGQLFRRTTNTKRKGEIVIFLTARVIEGNEVGAAVSPNQSPSKDAARK